MDGIITVKDTRENLTAMQQYHKYEAEKIAKSVNGEGIIDIINPTTIEEINEEEIEYNSGRSR